MKLKKIIAVLSSLCMMMTMYINVTGRNFILANADESIESSETTEDSYSGSCGENAVWAFDSESGTLTISGTGEMENYLNKTKPWQIYADNITSLVIEEGITTIGSYAFQGFYQLVSVNLPSSLVIINDNAFRSCRALESIIIPKGVEKIQEEAFYNCLNLKEINADSENNNFISIDGVLFNNNMTNLIVVPYGKNLEEYTVPDGVEVISKSAFSYQYSLKSVILPDSLKTIEDNAFWGCNKLKEVIIPDGTEFIGDYIFVNCSSLEIIDIPQSVSHIGRDAFSGTIFYSNLKSESDDFIIINNMLVGVTSSDSKIVVPSDITLISVRAFYNLSDLTEVVIPDGCTVCVGAFYGCSALKSIIFGNNCTLSGDYKDVFDCDALEELSFGDDCIVCEKVCKNWSGLKSVILGDNCSVSKNAFGGCEGLKSITAGDNCNFGEDAFSYCLSLDNVTAGNNCNFSHGAFRDCSSLEKFTAGNNCTLGDRVFYGDPFETFKLSEFTVNGNFSFEGNAFYEDFDVRFPDLSVKYERPALDYKYQDNAENKLNTAYSDVRKFDNIDVNSTFSSSTDYNNGYWSVDDVQEIQDSTGTLYAAVKQKNGVALVPHDINKEIMNFSKDDFKFGSAVFDDEDNIYIMWAKSISDDDIKKAREEKYANIVVVKYDKSGNIITEYGFPVNLLFAQRPYDAGNAHLGWKNNVLLVYFHTEWTSGHQGSVAAAVNTETSEIIYSSGWQGSHAFGSCMIPTDYGYAAIQMGDVEDSSRGINFNSYYIESPENVEFGYLSGAGHKTLYHSSGQYGTNENKLDGNTTYTHMGGLAKSNTTYAVAGKSERVYTSDIYKSSDLRTGNYDVFVKLVDQTLLSNVSGLAGESRIDEATGEIADKNVIWLTECNETEQAGQVKIVTLEDGSYCVLWEKFINGDFDSVRYVIMDECGNIIRRETAINNARLSDTSVQPVVEGDTLRWAVGNNSDNSLIWYTVNLNEFTSSDELYAPLERLAKENNISLVLEDGYYGSCGNNIYWSYLRENGTLLIAGSGDMNYSYQSPWIKYADSVTDVIIDNNITSIEDSSFKNFSMMTSVKLSDSLKKISDNTFYGCEKLVSVNIPGSVTELGEYAFRGCKSLESINLPEGITDIGNHAFYECENLKEVNFPDSLKTIGNRAFSDCSELTEISIGENVEKIGEKAFYNCKKLKNINVYSSYVEIGDNAFGYYYSYFSDNEDGNVLCDDVIINCVNNSTAKKYAQEKNIEFTEKVSTDEIYKIFENIIKENYISLVLEEGHYGNFSNIHWVYMEENSTLLIAGNGEMKSQIKYPWSEYADSATNVIIDNNITSIGEGAFEYFDLITSVALPDSLTDIEEYAFSSCDSLENISLPEGITNINDNAFYGCDNLTSVTLPGTLTELGENVFAYCKSLKSINIPEGITDIKDYTFNYCINLKEVNLPGTLKTIGFYAFVDCDNLESVYIPESVNNIDEYAFYSCEKLTEINIGENIENIGKKAFYNCSSLKNVTVKSSNVAIGDKAFGYRSIYSDGEYEYKKIDDVTIYGNPDSTVKTYAQENDIKFLEIGSITTTTTITTTTQTTTTITTATNPIIITTTTEPTTATNPIIITTTTESITTNNKMTTSTTATESTTLAVTSTTTDTTTEPSTKRIAGDVNGDAKVNFKDVVLIRRYIAGGWNIEINEEVADVNGDGKVNFKDVVLIRRYIAGGWNITLQ